jgi:archaellum biogenesis ATPase FlaH
MKKPGIDSEWDDAEEEEAEARERYGDAFPEADDAATQPTDRTEAAEESPASHSSPLTTHRSPLAPNYHYLSHLTDGHLPDLDYYRADNLFVAKTANGWLRESQTQKVQRPLFGEFWNEGELAIMFADTGKGKSILAVQIGESIASGVAIPPFKLGTKAQRVVLFDFELDQQQFALRYSAPAGRGKKRVNYTFSDNLIRPQIGAMDDIPDEFKTYNEYLTQSLADLIELLQARVVIIDNITWLNASTQNPVAALRLMKTLKRLKQDRGLSILVLAHTPKRNNTSPLTINDLQGSKMLANFADNIFALGDSKIANDLRYLKHLKIRNAEIKYDAKKVVTLRLAKMPVRSSLTRRSPIFTPSVG